MKKQIPYLQKLLQDFIHDFDLLHGDLEEDARSLEVAVELSDDPAPVTHPSGLLATGAAQIIATLARAFPGSLELAQRMSSDDPFRLVDVEEGYGVFFPKDPEGNGWYLEIAGAVYQLSPDTRYRCEIFPTIWEEDTKKGGHLHREEQEE